MELVIASKNVHKIREIRAILKKNPNLDLFSLIDFPGYLPPPETGSTFEENATQKAVHAASALQKWTLGDDSGLVIPALGGAPGIYSARYAGEGATEKDNRAKLLREMSHLTDSGRGGYLECCMALASPAGLKKCVKAVCEGYITDEEKGNHGFGYDSLFLKYEYSKTFAELEEDIKNRISHRRKALDKISLILESSA